MKIVDLSRELYHRTPSYPGQPPIIHGVWKTHEEAFVDSGNIQGNSVMFFSMPDHGGTHMDAPRHFGITGTPINEYPLENCIVPGICIDLRHIAPKAEITPKDLEEAVRTEAERRPEVLRLMKRKGVGSVVALAFVLTLGPIERFPNSRKMVSYLGLNPSEDSSGGHQRLGAISKQGNEMMRWLLVEAGQSAAQFDPELRRKYQRLKFRRGGKVAKVALARQLAVRLYWTLRHASPATPPLRMPGSPAEPMVDVSPSTV